MEPLNKPENDTIKQSVKNPTPGDELTRSSSVSSESVEIRASDFSFEDSYQLNLNERGSFVVDAYKTDTATPGNASTLQTPPVQVMERPQDETAYRIPSHIFNSNKPSNLNQEWSIASNDSLFSIHTGNMSFTKDQFSSLLKSGELSTYAAPGELPPPSPVLRSGDKIPPKPGNNYKSGEQIIANHFKTNSTPVENKPYNVEATTQPKVSQSENDPQLTVKTKTDELLVKKNDRPSTSDEVRPSTSVSHHSDTSVQSFAFPVLAEFERQQSVNSGQSRTDQHKKTSKVAADDGEKATSAPTTATTTSSSNPWFSCFCCCSCF